MARTLELDTITEPGNSSTANITLSSDTTTTMPKVDINGGAIDATTVGAATPSTVAATAISATGNATVGGTLGVTGNTTVGGTLGVTGATTLSSTAAITGNTTVGGTLVVTGAITGSSTLTATTINGIEMRYSRPNSLALYNLGVGAGSLDSLVAVNTDGPQRNTAFGVNTLTANEDAKNNTAVGYDALNSIVGAWGGVYGDGNTAVGAFAGDDITNGHSNVMIGYRSGTSNAPSGSVTTANGVLCLGDDNIANFYCADTSISSSDERDKTDVEDFTPGLEWIEAMRPVTYHWDKRSWYTEYNEETGEVTSQPAPDGTHKKDKKNIGFIAQEVLEIEKAHGFADNRNDMLTVNLNEDETAYGMKYERLVPVLVNAVKELSAKIKALESA